MTRLREICTGVRRRGILLAAVAALAPLGSSQANLLTDLFKGHKPDKPAKHAARHERSRPAKHAAPKHRAEKPKRNAENSEESSPPRPAETTCDPAKFRIVVDVGHTAESDGATSARNVAEFVFNLRLARRVADRLKAEGFNETKLLVTEGKARSSLVKRVAFANKWPADLFLSIHHDSVPNKLLDHWEFEGKTSHYSDRFSGYSVWVSHLNPDFNSSLAFAELVAKEMKAKGLDYARQYTMAIMGRYQHPILNRDTGVYSHDDLIVLRKTRMPAVLLEAGSIVNRDEELKMASPEQRGITAGAVASAMKQYCDARRAKPEKIDKPESAQR